MALVVTIVVLLILAGITITLLFGDNGVISKAERASEATKRAEVIENARLDILDKQLEKNGSNISQTELEEILTKYAEGGADGIIKNDEGNITGIKVEGVTDVISIAEIYGGTFGEESGITAADIVTSGSQSSYYGKTVNYTVADSTYQSTLTSNSITWKIFYIGSDYTTTGSSHIYLIASDYVPRTCLPASSEGNSLNDGSTSYPRAAYFTNILNDYSGSASVTSSELKKLNNSWFTNNTSASENNNWKAVAYMMDTSSGVWGKYANTTYADYAVGGPPIEMLMTSYSQKHSVNYQAQATSATGYQISMNGGSNWYNCMQSSSQYLDTSDSTYVLSSTTNAHYMWVTSPSDYGAYYVMCVNYDGYVSALDYVNGNIGFRPLVCLKSTVKLQEQSDGTFSLM